MLDGMHEGLLILNKSKSDSQINATSTKSVAFINRPARKLISGFIGCGLEERSEESLNKIIKLKSLAPISKESGKLNF